MKEKVSICPCLWLLQNNFYNITWPSALGQKFLSLYVRVCIYTQVHCWFYGTLGSSDFLDYPFCRTISGQSLRKESNGTRTICPGHPGAKITNHKVSRRSQLWKWICWPQPGQSSRALTTGDGFDPPIGRECRLWERNCQFWPCRNSTDPATGGEIRSTNQRGCPNDVKIAKGPERQHFHTEVMCTRKELP